MPPEVSATHRSPQPQPTQDRTMQDTLISAADFRVRTVNNNEGSNILTLDSCTFAKSHLALVHRFAVANSRSIPRIDCLNSYMTPSIALIHRDMDRKSP